MTKNTTKTIAIILSSLFLLGLTVFLAYKIYQTRQENLAPTEPEAVSEACTLEFSIKPEPAEPECYQACDLNNDLCPNGLVCQNIGGNPICVNPDCPEEEDCVCPEPIPECYQACDLDNDLCAGNLVCQEVNGNPVCVNSNCPEEEDCVCPEPIPECYQACNLDNDLCAGDLICQKIGENPVCVNPDCPEEEDCTCPGEPTATPTPTSTPTPTTAPTETLIVETTLTPTSPPPTALPEAGSILPTLGVILGGLTLTVLGFFFVF